MKNRLLLTIIALIAISFKTLSQTTGIFTDSRDGKVYKTVTIGTQTWMAENLAYKTDNGCYAYANDTNNAIVFGYLYSWETARKVCPEGWHLPSKAEWNTLINFLDSSEVAGGKLKSKSFWKTKNDSISGYSHVRSCSHKHTEKKHDSVLINSSKFNGLPGGGYYMNNIFDYKGIYATWWTSTESDGQSYIIFIFDNSAGIMSSLANKYYGFYIRCLKDNNR